MRIQIFQTLCVLVALCGCQSAGLMADAPTPEMAVAASAADQTVRIQQDRQAILAMAGNYKVRFDFLETVSFVEGYEPKERYLSGAHEAVRVVEDRPGFISLQHILVVGNAEQQFPIKHWRQDWIYEPEQVLTFIGGNAWEMRPTTPDERRGKWAQVVYQVDDSPRYGALAAWSHDNGVSQWSPPPQLRPLPRRDMTKRDDYHAVLAVNRHAITPDGWVHEQDNSKLILRDEPHVLVREVGVNTYRRFDDFAFNVADTYWRETAAYWKDVRAAWSALEQSNAEFGLTLKGEPEELYMPLLELSSEVQDGKTSSEDAARSARDVIKQYTTSQLPPLAQRLRAQATNPPAAR
ncbi:MAG: DUF6607 family protein [Pseudomonadota bacterium]